MNRTAIDAWIIDLLAGISAGLLAWVIASFIRRQPARVRDAEQVPAMLRWLGGPVNEALPLARTLLTPQRRAALARRVRHAGLQYGMEPETFEALRIVSTCGLAVVGVMVGVMLRLRSGPVGAGLLADVSRGAVLGGLLGWAYPSLWLRQRVAIRNAQIRRVLPFYLDLMTLCVGAGLGMRMALERAVSKGPPGLFQEELQRVLRDMRAGRGLAASFHDLGERVDVPGVSHFAMAVVRAERMGLSLGPVLRMQSEQQRAERFLRAERLALEAPVKMLFPLIVFVFPCTFIVIFFPLIVRFLGAAS